MELALRVLPHGRLPHPGAALAVNPTDGGLHAQQAGPGRRPVWKRRAVRHRLRVEILLRRAYARHPPA